MRKTFIVGGIALVALAAGCQPEASPAFKPHNVPGATTPAGTKAKPTKAAAIQITEGTWSVPGEVKPGTYTTTGTGRGCYWERLKGTSGDFEDIIANGNVDAGARGRVTVKATDKAIKFEQDCVWTKSK